MSRHKAYGLNPRDCLKTTLFQKWQRMVAPPGECGQNDDDIGDQRRRRSLYSLTVWGPAGLVICSWGINAENNDCSLDLTRGTVQKIVSHPQQTRLGLKNTGSFLGYLCQRGHANVFYFWQFIVISPLLSIIELMERISKRGSIYFQTLFCCAAVNRACSTPEQNVLFFSFRMHIK